MVFPRAPTTSEPTVLWSLVVHPTQVSSRQVSKLSSVQPAWFCTMALTLGGALQPTTFSTLGSTLQGPASGFAWNPGCPGSLDFQGQHWGSPRQTRLVSHSAGTTHHLTTTCHRSVTDGSSPGEGVQFPPGPGQACWKGPPMFCSLLSDLIPIAGRPLFLSPSVWLKSEHHL